MNENFKMNICNCHNALALYTSCMMQDKEHETENVEFLYASSFLYELGQNI